CAGDHGDPRLRIGRDLGPDAGELAVHLLVGGVVLVRPVHGDEQHAVVPALEEEMLVLGELHAAPYWSVAFAQLIVRPPLTLTVWPVMKDASSEARNTTIPATSSGCPSRRNGIALVRASRSFGPANEANSAVSVGPGHTQLTLTWFLAISLASDLVKAMTPPLAAE